MSGLELRTLSDRDISVSIDGNPLVVIDVPPGMACVCYEDSGTILGPPQKRRAAAKLFDLSKAARTVYDEAFSRIDEGTPGKIIIRGGKYDDYIGYFVMFEGPRE